VPAPIPEAAPTDSAAVVPVAAVASAEATVNVNVTAPPAAPPAKESIIENPIEFAIVSIIFVATVLLIALTGN
jgi:hypothetical protein